MRNRKLIKISEGPQGIGRNAIVPRYCTTTKTHITTLTRLTMKLLDVEILGRYYLRLDGQLVVAHNDDMNSSLKTNFSRKLDVIFSSCRGYMVNVGVYSCSQVSSQ